jgi:hypothetical protein
MCSFIIKEKELNSYLRMKTPVKVIRREYVKSPLLRQKIKLSGLNVSPYGKEYLKVLDWHERCSAVCY